MSVEGFQITIPGLTSTADLSSYQYYPVRFTGERTIGLLSTTANGTDLTIGILQNKPNAAGASAVVCALGISKAIMGGTASYGDLIGNDTANNQKPVKITENQTSNSNAIWGRVIDGASSSQYATLLINCINLQVGTS